MTLTQPSPLLHSAAAARFALPTAPAARCLHQIRTLRRTDRTTLRDTLELSQPSVARHVSTLIDAGLVEQVAAPESSSRGGRPGTRLLPDGRHLTFLGAHVGLRITQLVACDATGRILAHRKLPLDMAVVDPGDALEAIGHGLAALAPANSPVVSAGLALSAHVDEAGLVSSETYGWDHVDAASRVAAQINVPVAVAGGVAAMAAHELAATPLANTRTMPADAKPSQPDSTLYFYAREFVGHAWIFNGAVHRPHSGAASRAFQRIGAQGSFAASPPGGTHPLSSTALLSAAASKGIPARNVAELVRIGRPGADPHGLERSGSVGADQTQEAAKLLDERAELLSRSIALAVDIVDPQSLVFAGEAFTVDPQAIRVVARTLRNQPGIPRNLRLQTASSSILLDAAKTVALNALWTNPLEVLHERFGAELPTAN